MSEELNNPPTGPFKPNIYPVMYWALAYGIIAGMILFLIYLLSQYITIVWFPVFLTGLVWGGYRNYVKQKKAWSNTHGIPLTPQSPLEEFKEAAQDIIGASRDMMAEQAEEDAAREQAEQTQAMQEQQMTEQEMPPEPENAPPQSQHPPQQNFQPNQPPNTPPRPPEQT